jgi:soluble lytic murein transglycosylase
MKPLALGFSALLLLALTVSPRSRQRVGSPEDESTAVVLVPTDHPVVVPRLNDLWYVPAAAMEVLPRPEYAGLRAAMHLFDEGDYEASRPRLLGQATESGRLRDYALYYTALADLRLEHPLEARRAFQLLQERSPIGYLSEAAALGEAESLEALEDYRAAMAIYERLTEGVPLDPADVLTRLGRAAKRAGDDAKAQEAFGSVHYGFPLETAAAEAGKEYAALPNLPPIGEGTVRYRLELVRAERLFGAGRYSEARQGFSTLSSAAAAGDRALVQLRLAQCDYWLRKYRSARRGLQSHTVAGPYQPEALYYVALTLRAVGDRVGYLKIVRQVADRFPTDPWAERALDHLATHHVLVDEDAEADAAFRELYRRFPRGRVAERAAWKIGWRSYRERRYAETVRFFERAAADFPRSDYRPAWLYWSGRAHAALSADKLAAARFILTADDYQNSYYGRLALQRLGGRRRPPRVVRATRGDILLPPANVAVISALLEAERYRDALNELRYAQRRWGDSAPLQATVAWTQWKLGGAETARSRFDLMRGSINTMRRAYPQFIAAGGEQLPREILTRVFPLAYWDLIQKYAKENGLDEYLVAALVAQESTFVRDVRSSANAVGLMQLVPGTARRYAGRLNLKYSSALLIDPESNLGMGTAYLADKVKEFGSVHLALASYNAGETPVRRWLQERPGLTDQEEFIDDIPYRETRTYIKRILGTAEDYRQLYSPSTN